jgi:hypothetical protein
MRVEMDWGVATTKAPEATGELKALGRLMELSCDVSRAAVALYDTEQATLGMTLMETADRLADEAGAWAGRCGYTMDEVTQPLWK